MYVSEVFCADFSMGVGGCQYLFVGMVNIIVILYNGFIEIKEILNMLDFGDLALIWVAISVILAVRLIW